MTTQTTPRARIRHRTALAVGLLAISLLTVSLFVAAAPSPRFETTADDTWYEGEGEATMGLHGVSNDELAIEAFFPRESYRPGTTATLRFESTLERVRLKVFHAGPEWGKTVGDNEMRGLPATDPVLLDRISSGGSTRIPIGNWATGLYFAQLTAKGGRVGYAPFVVPPKRLGRNRVAVVLPTRSWQAYNFRDADGDGIGDTWYASEDDRVTAVLHRPFLNRGVPPHFRGYDLPFLHWLNRTGKQVDYLSQAELDAVPDAATLRRAYDVLYFPGHHEYVTTREYDVVEGFRDRGGSLVMLSADNFCWRIDLEHGVMTRVAKWRDVGRPEASLLGVQYIGNDEGKSRSAWYLRKAPATRWVFAKTRASTTGAFSNGGIEIDHTNSSSPQGTQVLAELPNLLGPGRTGQMSYYSTTKGAEVFSAGAFTLAGSSRQWAVKQLLENLWAHFTATPRAPHSPAGG